MHHLERFMGVDGKVSIYPQSVSITRPTRGQRGFWSISMESNQLNQITNFICGIADDVPRDLPYATDAWYNESSVKGSYDSSFTRYFYKPKPLRRLGGIL